MKVIMVSDLFPDDYGRLDGLSSIPGGAELNDQEAIRFFEDQGLLKQRINCFQLDTNFLEENKDCFFFVCNFAMMDQPSMDYMAQNCKYLIYEHDYKFLKTRNPIFYVDFAVPQDQLLPNRINFYRNAQRVVFLSKLQQEIYLKNFDIERYCNIKCSLFSEEKINFMLEQSKNEKLTDFGVMESTDPRKRTADAVKWCEDKGHSYNLFSSPDNKEFLKMMSQYRNFIFFPGHPEPTPRIAIEASLMGVNFVSNKSLIGVAYEDWWGQQGEELGSTLLNLKADAYKVFEEVYGECA